MAIDSFSIIPANNYSWHRNYSMLFIDQPVGTGFSYTDPSGYLKNVTQTSKQLFIALTQFLKMFPWLQKVEFYVTGESYAGKYIPSLGYEIYQENESYKNEFQINLKVTKFLNFSFKFCWNFVNLITQLKFQVVLLISSKFNKNVTFQGLAIGNGYTDPINMLHYSEFALQQGLIDRHAFNLMKVYEFLGREFIDDPESKIVSVFVKN